MTDGKTTSMAAYARHCRKSRQAIAQGIQQGLLSESLVRGVRGEWRIRDVAAADREWLENTRENGSGSTFQAARARREIARAEAAERENAERRGELVPASEVAARWVTIITNSRNALLAIPSRLRERLPHLTVADLGAIEDAIVEGLRDLATSPTKGGKS